jgi:hypothetical protein
MIAHHLVLEKRLKLKCLIRCVSKHPRHLVRTHVVMLLPAEALGFQLTLHRSIASGHALRHWHHHIVHVSMVSGCALLHWCDIVHINHMGLPDIMATAAGPTQSPSA